MMKVVRRVGLTARLSLYLALILAATGPAGAASTYWQYDPASPGYWFDPANWTNSVPASEDTAYVENGGTAGIPWGAAETMDLNIGHSDGTTGAVEHSGGSNTIQNALSLGYWSGASGSYALSGTGQLRAKYERVGISGIGTFTQTGGSNIVDSGLQIGLGSSGEGAYHLQGGALSANYIWVGNRSSSPGPHRLNWTGGTLDAESIYVYAGGTMDVDHDWTYDGRLTISGGTVDLGPSSLTLDVAASSWHGVSLTDGLLASTNQYVGRTGEGSVTQNGGINVLSGSLYLGCEAGSSGRYYMNGGTLDVRDGVVLVGVGGGATFGLYGGTVVADELRRGGGSFWSQPSSTLRVNRLTEFGSSRSFGGSLEIGHSGGAGAGSHAVGPGESLTVGQRLLVGSDAPATLAQSGGFVTAGCLRIGGPGRYELTDGTLTVAGLALAGELDFLDNPVALNWDSVIVDFSPGRSVLNGRNASLTLGLNSLAILPPGFDPGAVFGIYTNSGLTHTPGAPLTVPAWRGFGGCGTVTGHVLCAGTITAAADNGINLTAGVEVSGAAAVQLGEGTLTVDDAVSGISGGALSAATVNIGETGAGTFTHSGGSVRVEEKLSLGHAPGASGTYAISTGSLEVTDLIVGEGGSGHLDIQSPAAEITVSCDLRFGGDSTFSAAPGARIRMSSETPDPSTFPDFAIESTDPIALAGLANLTLTIEGGAVWPPYFYFERAGEDRGAVLDGWTNNFALGTLEVGRLLFLVDYFDNFPDRPEAAYVANLILKPGARISGLRYHKLYYLNGGEPKGLFEGDTTLDGEVNYLDLGIVASNYGKTSAVWTDGDFTGDERVNYLDLGILASNYGQSTTGAGGSVPEPAAVLLTCAGAAVGVLRRSRRRGR